MLAYPIATVALLALTGSVESSSSTLKFPPKKAPTKLNFLRDMDRRKNQRRRKLSSSEFQRELYKDSKKSQALRKKLIEKSTVTKVPGAPAEVEVKPTADALKNHAGERKLEDAAEAQQDYSQYYDANKDYSSYYKYSANHDGTDDYFGAFGEWDNGFGFDPTQFSLSYHRCASVTQFDDEMAATEDSNTVFVTKRFAVFRFCPEQTCMGFQAEGDCGCEDQCEAIADYNAAQGYSAGDDDEDMCEEACEEQCGIWFQQMQLFSGATAQESEANQMQQANAYGAASEVQANAYGEEDEQAEEDEDADEGSQGSQDQDEDEDGDRKLQNQYNYNANWQQNSNPFRKYKFDPYYGDDDAQEVLGARGEGCQNNYGEYMIEMEDYLEMMLEWQSERFQQYQEYCEECMWKVYQQWVKNGGGRKLTSFEDFKASDKHRELGNYYGQCPEYDTCAEYQQINEVDDYSEYFECQEVEKANGQVAYVGPHCSADGFEITLGVFSDEDCNQYIGDGASIENFIGEEIEEDALRAYYNSAYGPTLEQLQFVMEDNVCIPCRKGDLMWTEENNYQYQGDDDDQDQQQVNYDNAEINELCQNLYEYSARCDKHYRSYGSKSKQAKYAEAVAQEDLACDFIDSVIMGNYDENGFVNLNNHNAYTVQNQPGWMGTNMYAQQLGEGISKVTALQVFGLIMSIMAVCILAAWSMTLHKSLTKTGPWRPRRGLRSAASPTPADLSRQNSGIVMGRSASNTSYYMS